jgi:glycosyltransferase involved in cell wall biosynthesis
LRILTFSSLFPNSIDPAYGIFIYQRAAKLAERPGIELEIVSPVPYFPGWLKIRRWRKSAELPSQETIIDLTVHHPRYFLLPKVWMPLHALSMFVGCLPRILELHRRDPIDCIDAHFIYPDGMAAVLLGKYLKVPVVVSARGTDINVYPSFRFIRPMIRWTLQQADAIIAVSAALMQGMVALGIDPGKIHVIPNGVDVKRFSRLSSEQVRTQLNLPANSQILLSVGALISSKGHQLLIRAFARVAPLHPALHLYILGDGPFRRELERLVAELGLQERVHLPGKQPNEVLCLWYNAAEASCLASAREGWPNVVTESLACGTPVVATRVGGIPEILHSPELGVLTDETVESIAAGLEQALSQTWSRPKISEMTRQRTWQVVAAEIEAVFAEQIQARSSFKREERIPPSTADR